MVEFDDYIAFIAVVERGSITSAAKHLGRSLAAVSRSLTALEADLGQTLVTRTTRASQATVAGLAFLARVKGALSDLSSAHDAIAVTDGRVEGPLTVSAAGMFGAAFVGSVALAFMERHPEVDVTVDLSDHVVDLVGEGVDLAVRLGTLFDSGLMARRLGMMAQFAFAAPVYLASHGWPGAPEDLTDHECLVRASSRHRHAWTLTRDDRRHEVAVTGRFRSNSSAICNAAALSGRGIAVAPYSQVRSMVEAGSLKVVLPDYAIDPMPVSVVWTRQQFLPVRTRTFIDHLAASIDGLLS